MYIYCIYMYLQINSPVKMTSAKTPPGREGQTVGVADSAPTQGVADEEYTVMDCESSITALDIVQLPLEKQGWKTLNMVTELLY